MISEIWFHVFWNLMSLPKAMSISRSEILRKKAAAASGGGGDRKVALGIGSWILKSDDWNLISLSKAMSIFWSEIWFMISKIWFPMTKIRFQKLDFGNQFSEIRVQKTDLRSQNPAELTGVNNKNTKCPIDAHCHRHCRRDPRITKYCIEVLHDFFTLERSFSESWETSCHSPGKLRSSKLAEPPNPL